MATFDELLVAASPLLAAGQANEGTLMGGPCLRAGGEFIAMVMKKSGKLVVKLPRARVDDLIGQGAGSPFAPAGKVFREWIEVADEDPASWPPLLDEALAFVGASGGVAGPD